MDTYLAAITRPWLLIVICTVLCRPEVCMNTKVVVVLMDAVRFAVELNAKVTGASCG
jgi:hypothetical protein